MNKSHLFITLIMLLSAGCTTAKGNFQTQFRADLTTSVEHIESTLRNKNMTITKSRRSTREAVIEANNVEFELKINLKELRNKEKVMAYFDATNKSISSDDPYESIRDIEKEVRLRINEGGYESFQIAAKDIEPPQIIITSHDINRGIKILDTSEKTTIIGKVTDKSKLLEVLFDNNKIELDEYGNFKKEVYLSKGINSFRITAVDVFQNKSSRELIIDRNEEQIIPTTSNYEITNWYNRQYAFLIGIDKYKNPNIPVLENAVNDAKALAGMLKSMGFIVHELYNNEATKDNIMTLLIKIQKNINREDSFLIYFAGHGQGLELDTGKRTGYIIPYDADIDLTSESVIEYENEAIALETMKKITEAMSSKHVALLLDSCFSGLVMKRSIPKMRALTMKHYIDFLNTKTINILTAGADQPVSDGSGHSPFTRAILDGLQRKEADFRDHDGYVTIEELYSYVKDKVEKTTDSRQQPQFDNMLGGNGIFIFKVR